MAANNWNDKTNNITNINNKLDIGSINVDLIKFCVYNNILLADSIKKTPYKWAIKDYTNTSKINIIISIVMNLEAEISNYIEDLLFICCCQVAKYNCPNKSNIENIWKDIIAL